MVADLVAFLGKNDPIGAPGIHVFDGQKERRFKAKFIKQGRDIVQLAIITIIVGEADSGL